MKTTTSTPYWKLKILRERIIKRNASRWLYFFHRLQIVIIMSMPLTIVTMFFVPPYMITVMIGLTMSLMVADAAGYIYFYHKMMNTVIENEGRSFARFIHTHG